MTLNFTSLCKLNIATVCVIHIVLLTLISVGYLRIIYNMKYDSSYSMTGDHFKTLCYSLGFYLFFLYLTLFLRRNELKKSASDK
jgi:hypothetical protein